MNRANDDYIKLKNLGYNLDENGIVTNPQGIEICKTNSKNKDRYKYIDIKLPRTNTVKQFKSNFRKVRIYIHKWQAYQKFFIKVISKKKVIIHKDGILSNNSRDNILIKTKSTYFQEIYNT